MMTLFIFLFVFGILIIVHEFGHFIFAKRIGVKVEKFSLGFGPRLFSKIKNDTEYSVSIVPLGGYVKLAGDNLEGYKGNSYEYLSKTPKERALIVFCGPLLNYILGFLCFWLIFFAGYPMLTTKVGGLLEGFGAQKAGIQVGDKIVAVDGKRIDFWEDLQKIIHAKTTSTTVNLVVLRENKEYTVEVNIKQKLLDDLLGQKRSVGLLGITPGDEIIKVKHGFLESFFLGIGKTLDLTALTYKALWRMITGQLALRESVTGPLGIFYITSKAASLGIIALLHLIAVLNISLAIFNLLPLPVLDGGHILFLGIEKIRGKTLSVKSERIITQMGFTVIVILALFVTYNDVVRFFGEKKISELDTETNKIKIIAELNSKIALLTSENQSLKENLQQLKSDLDQLKQEKDGLEAQFNSTAESKKAFKELKKQMHKVVIEIKEKTEAEKNNTGNRGFLIEDGKSTYSARIKRF